MQNIINGKHVDASDGSVINIINPYTGRKIDTVPNSTEKDVKKAVACAKKEQKLWKHVPINTKVELLKLFLNIFSRQCHSRLKTLYRKTVFSKERLTMLKAVKSSTGHTVFLKKI